MITGLGSPSESNDGFGFATIAELTVALRTGRVTAEKLAEHACSALETIGRRLNATATPMHDRAHREAVRAQQRLDRGDPSPLCGIPYGAKDIVAAVGAPTTWGSEYFREQRLTTDAMVVARLRRAGGVLAGKLALSELAGVGISRLPGSSMHGRGLNPWDLTRFAGGSSSGSAIAVAAGLLPWAIGSETAGSIVGPAAFCGVTGLRPTFGMVPRTGVMSPVPTLDKVGVLARSAEDCATVLAAIAGRHPGDPASRGRFAALTLQPDRLRALRIGFLEDELGECDPGSRTVLEAAVSEFRTLVSGFEARGLPTELSYTRALETIMAAESAATLRRHLDRSDFQLTDDDQLASLRGGAAIPATEYLDAMQTRDLAAEAARGLFADVDVLLSVSRPRTAPALDEPRVPRGGTISDTVRSAANLAGLPGVSFPCGLAADGLPVGLHVVGPPASDGLLLGVVAAYQETTRHHLAQPPMLTELTRATGQITTSVGSPRNASP